MTDAVWIYRKKKIRGRYEYQWSSRTWLIEFATGRKVKIVGGESPQTAQLKLCTTELEAT